MTPEETIREEVKTLRSRSRATGSPDEVMAAHIETALDDLVAERDRYREALGGLDASLMSGEFGFNERTTSLQDIARAALNPQGTNP